MLAPAIALLAGSFAGCGDDETTATNTTSTTTPAVTTTEQPTTTTEATTTTSTTVPETATTTAPSTTTTTPPTTTTTTTTPPTTTTTTTQPPRPSLLERGDRGADVEAVQARLDALAYWVGPVDGIFGMLTEQAVYAFQKVNGLAVDGVVGPRTRAALEDPAPYVPESRAGDVMEVDKSLQVLVHVVDGRVDEIWNTSTGTENPYTYNGEQYVADTPPGRHDVYRQVNGVREAALGDLYRPKYFHRDGIAIHGYGSVPPEPVSHGCVRVTRAGMDHIWATGMAPIGSVVLVHGTTPETTNAGSGPFAG